MAGRALFNVPSTGARDAQGRLDALEQSVSKLAADVDDAFSVGGKWETVRAAANYTAKPWQVVLCNPTAGGLTVIFPDPRKCALAQMIVKNDSSSANTITLRSLASGTFDGATSLTITTGRQFRQFFSDGIEWKDCGATVGGPLLIQTGTDADTTALANRFLYMPTLTAARTVTLPASPANGTFVRLLVSNVRDYPITVSGNGKNIDDRFFSVTSTYLVVNDGSLLEFVFIASENLWMMAVKSTPLISRRMRYHTADANTVGLWHGFGNLNDSSGNGFNLTIAAGTERYGGIGYGLQGFVFDGATFLHHNTNETALNIVGDITIEALVSVITQPSGPGAAAVCTYGQAGETGANDNYYWSMFAGNAAVGGKSNMAGVTTTTMLWEHSAGTNVQLDGDILTPLNEVHHWSWVRTGTSAKQYIDGFLQKTFTGLTLPTLGGAPTQVFTIGGGEGSVFFFTGIIASVKISNVARTEPYLRRDAIRCLGIGPGVLDATGVVD